MAKKSNPIVHAFIDSKEQSFVNKSRVFFDNKGIENEVKALSDGDLKLLLSNGKEFIVERKRYDDFVASYINNHLQDQAIRMNNNYPYYCCIIHGDMGDIYRAANYNPALKRINQRSVEKMHETMELIYRLPCFFVKDEKQYFNKIMSLSNRIIKTDNFNLVKTSAKVNNQPEVSILMIANGVGEKTARLLLNEFDSAECFKCIS
jgi:ERCC4-type nuclease